MAQIQEDLIDALVEDLKKDRSHIRNIVELLEDGATAAFVAYYRKEQTGGMTEAEIHKIYDQYAAMAELRSRKRVILKAIRKQNRMTPGLEDSINACTERSCLEDIYVPFKPKKQSIAKEAKDKGIEPFANELLNLGVEGNPSEMAIRASQALGDGMTAEDALKGIADIFIEKISEDPIVRGKLREHARTEGVIKSKVAPKKAGDKSRFQNYYDFSESISTIPAHRMLALRRGEKEGILSVDLEFNDEKALAIMEERFPLSEDESKREFMQQVIKCAVDQQLKPSISKEVRAEAKRRADHESISVFSENLREILLSPPAGDVCVIGVDPSVRSGAKLAVVDSKGQYCESAFIIVTEPEPKMEEAKQILTGLIEKYKPGYLAVGNGSSSKKTEKGLRKLLKEIENPPSLVVVNESGANLYSSSDVGKDEFPNLDVTIRGAVSIARRHQDPLTELIKVDARSIGVGQYQYDVNQTLLRRKLDEVVESCVNLVGVDVNKASLSLLSHVSGISSDLAKAIIEYKTQNGRFGSKAKLTEIKGVGPKVFEQCAGFLRIPDGEIPLDNSRIHPESYYVVEKILQSMEKVLEDVYGKEECFESIDLNNWVDDKIGLPTLEDMISELKNPGNDPREAYQPVQYSSEVTEVEHLEKGMILEGKVSNVTRFGVFVDIGVYQDGLVHISEISNHFIKDPTEVLKVGKIVKVKVIDVDYDQKRISLSIKALSETHKGGGGHGQKRGSKHRKWDPKSAKGQAKSRKQKPVKKPVQRVPEKLKTMDDLLSRFGDPFKQK